MEIDLSDEAALVKARQGIEDDVDWALEAAVDTFVTQVIDDAGQALNAPVLLAAGRYRDPFAFTNIMKRWYDTIRVLARTLTGIGNVEATLADSDLPSRLYADVRDVLIQAKREDWTEYRTKRHLSRILIPKMSSGRWDSRAAYRASIRRMARTLATENFGKIVEDELSAQGWGYKEWVSHHDLRVRDSHQDADGQTVPVGSAFIIGGAAVRYPGDHLAPIGQTANCRCIIKGKGK